MLWYYYNTYIVKNIGQKKHSMRMVLQRVTAAQITVQGSIVGSIGTGLVVLVGITNNDTMQDVAWLTHKLLHMRIFDNEQGIMDCNVQDVQGELLIVSQFTLMASTRKGNRPSYSHAANEAIALPLYQQLVLHISQQYAGKVATGIFGAAMQVSLCNHGPVTIIIDSKLKE